MVQVNLMMIYLTKLIILSQLTMAKIFACASP